MRELFWVSREPLLETMKTTAQTPFETPALAFGLALLAACADPSNEVDGGESTSVDDPTTTMTTMDASSSETGTSSASTSDATTSNETTSDATTSDTTTSDPPTTGTTGTDATETETDSGSDSSGSACGNGVLDDAETCDDGNEQDDDGCASDCTPELYYRCVGEGAGSCAPIRILFALATNDDPPFRAAAAAVTGGVVDYLDVTGPVGDPAPTLAELEADYDCVFTHPGIPYADGEGLGEVLADYVDGGANVVLGIGWDHPPPNGLAGTAIAGPDYAPVSTEAFSVTEVNYAGDGASPIHTGVVAYSHFLVDTGVVLQGMGIQDGTFDNGTIATAYRPDFKVVYVNGTGQGDYGPTGDWGLLIANACSVGYLSPR